MDCINLCMIVTYMEQSLQQKDICGYLKEEQERKKKIRDSQWINRIIAAVFWLLKLITNGLERVNIKRKTVIEKVLVEGNRVF